ncbi:MAG: trimeric intracellular cation channel family protein [Anaerolineae bacterium]|nr:trimeric intracellular cation channel family protein [Anaerolineae bacterium]
MQTPISPLLTALDLIGTFAFALSGAAAGIKHRADLFGMLVLAFVAATAGGLTRDLLIGAVPPAAISDLNYTFVAIAAGLILFALPRVARQVGPLVALLDAAGLAVFAVSGTDKALAYGIHPVSAAMLGMLTGIGGGIVRDILVNEVPIVLRRDLYAVAALAAGVLVSVGYGLHWPAAPTGVAAMLLCFVLRVLAIQRRWGLPVAPPEVDEGSGGDGSRPDRWES